MLARLHVYICTIVRGWGGGVPGESPARLFTFKLSVYVCLSCLTGVCIHRDARTQAAAHSGEGCFSVRQVPVSSLPAPPEGCCPVCLWSLAL